MTETRILSKSRKRRGGEKEGCGYRRDAWQQSELCQCRIGSCSEIDWSRDSCKGPHFPELLDQLKGMKSREEGKEGGSLLVSGSNGKHGNLRWRTYMRMKRASRSEIKRECRCGKKSEGKIV